MSEPPLAINALTTEARNPASADLDRLDARSIVELMSAEDSRVVAAVRSQAGVIARAIDVIAERIADGGRLIYVGAGTSGRLGVLDASECPPTFGIPPGMVIGVIAGGDTALRTAVEDVEDDANAGRRDLEALDVGERDVVVGLTASGRTPYVLGALEYARTRRAFTLAVTSDDDTEIERVANLTIAPVVGPEVLSGSTRLKAGTAQKLVLNMLSTGSMVLLGKTYGNLMVDVRPSNSKLRARAVGMVVHVTGKDRDDSVELLRHCDWEVSTAIVCGLSGVGPSRARAAIAEQGSVRRALDRLGARDDRSPHEPLAGSVHGNETGGEGTN